MVNTFCSVLSAKIFTKCVCYQNIFLPIFGIAFFFSGMSNIFAAEVLVRITGCCEFVTTQAWMLWHLWRAAWTWWQGCPGPPSPSSGPCTCTLSARSYVTKATNVKTRSPSNFKSTGTVRPDWIYMRVVPLDRPWKGHHLLKVFDFLISLLNIS